MSFIEVKNLNKTYEENKKSKGMCTLKDVNFEVEKGEFFCILGPSGCGKSTLLNIMSGFEKPNSGEVLINGKKVTGSNSKNLIVFQELGLFAWKNVAKNIEFGLKIKDIDKKQRDEKVKEFIDLVNLNGFENKPVTKLSGGMKQRVAIARALIMDPTVLFMDEPFGALDEMTRIKMEIELMRIWKEKNITVIFVTHDIDSAIYLGDRIAIMSPQPGTIQKIIDVKMDRPHDIASEKIDVIKKQILKEFGI